MRTVHTIFRVANGPDSNFYILDKSNREVMYGGGEEIICYCLEEINLVPYYHDEPITISKRQFVDTKRIIDKFVS